MDNNYISLYRKYRPTAFNAVAGHDWIKNILRAEIKKHTLPSALLFVGQKGTGKTSLAKILAKTINCQNLNTETSEACDKCDNCIAANNNSHPDILEIDAASNNGVDEIRNMKANVFTLPILGAQKVFIIDEVHMLTVNAFNAFLKTLEEPPTHVTFILATTEYNKIPATIISRCQIFNFQKIEIEALKKRVNEILMLEGYNATEEVLDEIYYLSDGSLRDALNYVEQLMMVCEKTLDLEKLTQLFSVATKRDKLTILQHVFAGQTNELINYFNTSIKKGLSIETLILQLLDILKEIIEVKLTGNFENLSYLTNDEWKLFENVSRETLFALADNLAAVYEKTNRTNITYQYLLITLLKPLETTPKTNFVSDTQISWVNNNVAKRNNILDLKSSDTFKNEEYNDASIIEKESMVEVKTKNDDHPTDEKLAEPEPIDTDNIDDQKIQIDEDAPPVIISHFKSNPIKYDSTKAEENKYDLIANFNFANADEIAFDHKKILNVLMGAKKDERQKWADAITNLFQDGATIDLSLTIFHDAKIVAAAQDAIIVHVDKKTFAKVANNLLQDNNFRALLFKTVNLEPVNIIVIEKETWAQVKDEYARLKNANELWEYNPHLFDDFYLTVIRSNSAFDAKEDELLKTAKDFFGVGAIKVVD